MLSHQQPDLPIDPRLAMASLESAIGDPRHGLPEHIFLFVSRITPLVNVDLLIQDDNGRTLLTWRDDQFYGSGWHIPGGIIRYKERLLDRLHLTARNELGAAVDVSPTPLLVTESIRPDRSRGHFISLLYRCKLSTVPDVRLQAPDANPQPGQWRWFDGCPGDLLVDQLPYAPFFAPVDKAISLR